MNIAVTANRNRTLVLLSVVLAMAFGSYSYLTLPAYEDPKILIREAVVVTEFPGLSAERMELLVTKRLEEAIRQIPEVEEIRSTSRAGISIIHAEVYDRYFNLDQIWDDLRENVAEARAGLPEGTGTPIVNDDFGDVAVTTVALTADGFSMGEMHDIAQHVRDHLYSVAGTKAVELHGVQNERIFVETSEATLAQIGIDRNQLAATLRDQNMIQPGGVIDTGERMFVVEPTGNFDSLEQLRETLIPLPGPRVVPLRDVATITRATTDPPVTKAYFNGKPTIVLAVSMLDGYRLLEYAPRLREKLSELESSLPVGYALDIVTYQADQVAASVFGVTTNVLQTLGIVLLVVVLFLGLRTGLIVGSIVPAVMLVTLAVMGFVGIPLERMSLATLVIALGLLVDNGIVIAEDFKRRIEEGTDRDAALKQTGQELSFPLLTSTLTTILVFLPLMMTEHAAGQYTRSISLVILISLMASWVLAMVLTPILCHRFIQADSSSASGAGGMFAPLERVYSRILRTILAHRFAFLVSMAGVLAVSIWGAMNASQKFFPVSDRAQVLITLDLPSDVTLNTTDDEIERIMPILGDEERFPYIESFAAYAGYGGPRFVLSLAPLDPAPNKGFIVANLRGIADMPTALSELRAMFRETFPALDARVVDMFLGPSDPGVFQAQIKGPDAEVLRDKAGELEGILRSVPGTIDVFQDWENPMPKLVVEIDQARARRAGVSSASVASALSAYFSGIGVSEYREGDDTFPIVLRAMSDERKTVERLRNLSVRTTSGEIVALEQVAGIGFDTDLAVVQRENLTRTITVEGRPLEMSPEDMAVIVAPRLEELQATLPAGHTVEFDGVVIDSVEGRSALLSNMPLCLALVLLLLVGQFNSLKRPLIILTTIPLLISGVALGLHLMHANFSFMVLLGVFALAGIIINNAIVLIDRIDIERAADDQDDFEAIINASTRRLRPIVMTTVTTVLGLLPLIIGHDALFYGMASIMASGLAVGTIMTLGVTPALYAVVFGLRAASSDGHSRELTSGPLTCS